jgi:Tfp pilus assembly protein PilZ
VTLLGTVTNVSPNGLFIRTWVSIAKGSEVELKLKVGDEDISIKGRVIWSATEQDDTQNLGLGIEFEESTDGMTIVGHLRGSQIPKPH